MIQKTDNRWTLLLGHRSVVRASAHFLWAVVITATVWLGGRADGVVYAQATSASATPVKPAECTVAPRSPEDLAALLTAPPGLIRSGMDGTHVATPTLPEGGNPADSATVDLVTATAREVVACLNAGDFARLFSLYSDHYLLAVWGGVDGPDLSDDAIAARIQALATPVPQSEDEQLALVAVEDVRVLPDGHVLATVINNRGGSRTSFVKVGDQYLIDWAYTLPNEGTPAPS